MKATNHHGVFVTGTDTGVGKTLIAASLLAGIRDSGCDAVPMKPVQTGGLSRRGRLIAPDLSFCLNRAGLTPSISERADMAPYCFRKACSPHLAAAQAGAPIRLGVIGKAFLRLLRAHEMVVVEGAGGVMAPLSDRLTMLDLMVKLGLPVILVARPGLGTLNHTLLSVQALRRARLNVLGVVINQSMPSRWGWIEEDNVRSIEKIGAVKVLACIRYGAEVPASWWCQAGHRW